MLCIKLDRTTMQGQGQGQGRIGCLQVEFDQAYSRVLQFS